MENNSKKIHNFGYSNRKKSFTVKKYTKKTSTPHKKQPSASEIYNALPVQKKEVLIRLISDAITYFIEQKSPVFIDRFGLLLPEEKKENVVSYYNQQAIIRPETRLKIIFEKSTELTQYHRNRYKNIIETKTLSQKVYPTIPSAILQNCDEPFFRKIILELFKELRTETVMQGASNLLFPIGTFYALHNRHGDNFKDWIAGSDIFLAPNYNTLISTGTGRYFIPAEFESAWEPFQYAYGAPLHEFSIDIRQEMLKIGYELPQGSNPSIRTAIFEVCPQKGPSYMLCCTEGLRNTYFNGSKPSKIELVFQVKCRNNLDTIELTSKTFALGWVLLNSTKSGTITSGIGLNCQAPLSGINSCKLSAIFTTKFLKIPRPTKTDNGSFSYINIIWISDSESQLLEKNSADHLLNILKHRKLDQITHPERPCLLRSSSFTSNASTYERFLSPSPLAEEKKHNKEFAL